MTHAPHIALIPQLWQTAALLIVAGFSGGWWQRRPAATLAKIRVERHLRNQTRR